MINLNGDQKRVMSACASMCTTNLTTPQAAIIQGPPGTGKSSLVYCLAGKLNVNLCILTLSERDLGDDELMNRLAAAPKNSIVLLEDIDVAIPSQKRRHDLEAQTRRKEDKYKDNINRYIK